MQTEHIEALFSKKLSEYLSLGYESFFFISAMN